MRRENTQESEYSKVESVVIDTKYKSMVNEYESTISSLRSQVILGGFFMWVDTVDGKEALGCAVEAERRGEGSEGLAFEGLIGDECQDGCGSESCE